MFFFLLFALTFAKDITFGIKFNGNVKLSTDQLVLTIPQEQLDTIIVDKCVDTDFIHFKIVKESNIYKIALYAAEQCSGEAVAKFELGEISTQITIPPFQEEITIQGDVKIKVSAPFGCLLSYLPQIAGTVDGSLNVAVVHSQFGAAVHTYSEGECKGTDEITKIISDVANKIKVTIAEAEIKFPENIVIAEGAINLFKNLEEKFYQFTTTKLPQLTEDIICEFNGKVTKIYKKIGDKMQYVSDAIMTKAEKIIGEVVKCTESGNCDLTNKFNITGDMNEKAKFAFAWATDKLQQLKTETGFSFDSLFNIFKKTEVGFSVNVDAEFKIKLDGAKEEIYKVVKQSNDKLKEIKTAVVESFGSYLEYNLGQCHKLSLKTVASSMNNLIPMPDSVMKILDQIDQMNDFVKKILQDAGVPIQGYSYKIDAMQTGADGKQFVSFAYYDNEKCEFEPMFDFIIGVISDKQVKDVETGYSLVKYLTSDECKQNNTNPLYIEHVNVDVCVNGYQFKYENGKLIQTKCTSSNMKQVSKTTEYQCDICVKCQQESGMTAEEYARVKCGASSMFVFFFAILFFILF